MQTPPYHDQRTIVLDVPPDAVIGAHSAWRINRNGKLRPIWPLTIWFSLVGVFFLAAFWPFANVILQESIAPTFIVTVRVVGVATGILVVWAASAWVHKGQWTFRKGVWVVLLSVMLGYYPTTIAGFRTLPAVSVAVYSQEVVVERPVLQVTRKSCDRGVRTRRKAVCRLLDRLGYRTEGYLFEFAWHMNHTMPIMWPNNAGFRASGPSGYSIPSEVALIQGRENALALRPERMRRLR